MRRSSIFVVLGLLLALTVGVHEQEVVEPFGERWVEAAGQGAVSTGPWMR